MSVWYYPYLNCIDIHPDVWIINEMLKEECWIYIGPFD